MCKIVTFAASNAPNVYMNKTSLASAKWKQLQPVSKEQIVVS